jgi:hypothetical protein
VSADALELDLAGDGKWTGLPVWSDEDAGAWAEPVVDALAQRRGVALEPAERAVVVQTWARMVEHARSVREVDGARVAAALAFVPMGSETALDLVPMAVTQLTGLVGEGLTRDAVVDQVVQSGELRVAPPMVDELETASGTALRVRQLLREPVTGGPDRVAASLVYVWDAPLDGAVVTLDAWFDDPTEARLVEPSFDTLAATLQMRLPVD